MMVPSAMASYIISNITGCTDPVTANNLFYQAICSYIELNAQVFYAWVAFSPPPASTPDPITIINATIKTSGTLTPSGATDPNSAMSMFAATLNANAATWMIQWPPGFALSPAFVIPTISLSPSMATDQMSAMTAVCTQIIAGLKAATPVAGGAHAAYTGSATFTSIL